MPWSPGSSSAVTLYPQKERSGLALLRQSQFIHNRDGNLTVPFQKSLEAVDLSFSHLVQQLFLSIQASPVVKVNS